MNHHSSYRLAWEIPPTYSRYSKPDALSVRYSPDGSRLCVGGSDQSVRGYRIFKDEAIIKSKPIFSWTNQLVRGKYLNAPVISVAFYLPERSDGIKLWTATTDGHIALWHMSTGRILQHFHAPCDVFSIASCHLGERRVIPKGASQEHQATGVPESQTSDHLIAFGGRDGHIYIHDTMSNSGSSLLMPSLYDETAQLQRLTDFSIDNTSNDGYHQIQSISFLSENILASGGWGHQLNIWDKRAGKVISRTWGPYIIGDGLDAFENLIVTASYREVNSEYLPSLELWDVRKLTASLPVKFSTAHSVKTPQVPDYTSTYRELDQSEAFDSSNKSPKFCSFNSDSQGTSFPPKLYSCVLVANGSEVLSGGSDGFWDLCSTVSGKSVLSYDSFDKSTEDQFSGKSGSHYGIFSVDISPDWQYAATAGEGAIVEIHHLKRKETVD